MYVSWMFHLDTSCAVTNYMVIQLIWGWLEFITLIFFHN